MSLRRLAPRSFIRLPSLHLLRVAPSKALTVALLAAHPKAQEEWDKQHSATD
ncbi:MAG TPA: hypothetical protein VFR48_06810 [Solirubrobacteraceae bacterium]|nr:hypothetical protein [Solirubrobacteraceae bacterium]